MTAIIIEHKELLRSEHHIFLLDLEWPPDTNAIMYFNDNPKDDSATLIFREQLVKQEFAWDFRDDFKGWHLWEHGGSNIETLKFKHLRLKGPWVWFFNVKGSYHTPKDLAKEIIFRLEVYLHYAE